MIDLENLRFPIGQISLDLSSIDEALDEESLQFQNDREANELVKATYRNPWKLPRV